MLVPLGGEHDPHLNFESHRPGQCEGGLGLRDGFPSNDWSYDVQYEDQDQEPDLAAPTPPVPQPQQGSHVRVQ
jgi:hypothetical protein